MSLLSLLFLSGCQEVRQGPLSHTLHIREHIQRLHNLNSSRKFISLQFITRNVIETRDSFRHSRSRTNIQFHRESYFEPTNRGSNDSKS